MSTCISRSGEYGEHVFPAAPGPTDPGDDYCQRCGVLNEDRLAQEVVALKAKIKKLKAKIKKLEAEVRKWKLDADANRADDGTARDVAWQQA